MAINTATTWDKALKPIFRDLSTLWYPEAVTAAQLKKDPSYEGQKRVIPVLTEAGMATKSFASAMANKTVITPQAFELDVVEGYSFGSISNLAVLKSKSDKGSVGRLVKSAVDAATYSFGRRISATFWGNGGGAIGQIGSISGPGTTITLADASKIPFFEKNMVLQGSATDGTSGSVLPGSATVTGVDRDAGTFTVSADIATLIIGATTNTYLFPHGDFGHGVVGLPAWCPATTLLAATTFKGVDRTQDLTRLAGSRFDANGSTVEDALIDAVARHHRNGGKPTECVMGPIKFSEFQKNAVSRGFTMVTKKTDKLDITFKAYQLPTSRGVIDVYSDPDCPEDFGWLFRMEDWTLFSADTCPHFDKQGSEKMFVEVGADAKEFRLIGYYNFECRNTANNACITW